MNSKFMRPRPLRQATTRMEKDTLSGEEPVGNKFIEACQEGHEEATAT